MLRLRLCLPWVWGLPISCLWAQDVVGNTASSEILLECSAKKLEKTTSPNILCNLLCGTGAGAACPAGTVLFCITLPAGLYPCVLEITLLNAPAWKFSVRIIGLMFSQCIAALLARRFSGDYTAKVLGHQCLKWGNLSSLLRHNSRDCFLYRSFCLLKPLFFSRFPQAFCSKLPSWPRAVVLPQLIFLSGQA